ncbi:MAG: hypothetical protein QG552_791 [Thermodesulfobacteriota bacterium]|nr:hypothetical protein [Thermodesulfobacteriota bacterium]
MEGEGLSIRTMKLIAYIEKAISHPYLALVFRLYIGGLFVYASLHKINYPVEFAETIATYQMVPYWGINLTAVVLPWCELISGILLISGVRARSATVIIGCLLVLFTTAIGVSLLRDAPISCGCFQTIGEKISLWTLFRDVLWIAMTVHVFFFDRVFHLEKRFSMILKEI